MSKPVRKITFIGAFVLAGILAGCSTASKKNETIVTNYKPGVPGGSYVEKYQTQLEITSINAASREISFKATDGTTNTFRAGPDFRSFDTYKVGDKVDVTVARELVAWFAQETAPKMSGLTPVIQNEAGTVPGILIAPTIEVSAVVLAVDPQNQAATLELSNGRKVTLNVRKDIDLTKVSIGTTGIIRTSAALAVMKNEH